MSTPPDGTRFMLLIGYPGMPDYPSISQDAGAVVPGATYNLSFYSAPRSDSSPANIGIYGPVSALQFTASIILRNGSVDTEIASTFVNPDLYAPGSWVQTTLSGTAPANATGNIVVKFDSRLGFRGGDNQQTGIDMVVLDGPLAAGVEGNDAGGKSKPAPANNQPPVLALPDPQTVVPGKVLSFNVSASDPDAGQTVVITAVGLPKGATFANGAFSWRANEPGSYGATFTAKDNGSPAMSTTKTITLTVTKPKAAKK